MTKSSLSRRNRKMSLLKPRNPRLEADNRMVHKLVKKISQEMAGAFYEWQATQRRYGDEFYNLYPDVETFMERDWPNFVKAAKECMVKQLTDPSVSDKDKTDIYDALLNDASLPYSQQEVQIMNFRH